MLRIGSKCLDLWIIYRWIRSWKRICINVPSLVTAGSCRQPWSERNTDQDQEIPFKPHLRYSNMPFIFHHLRKMISKSASVPNRCQRSALFEIRRFIMLILFIQKKKLKKRLDKRFLSCSSSFIWSCVLDRSFPPTSCSIRITNKDAVWGKIHLFWRDANAYRLCFDVVLFYTRLL